MLMKEQMFCIGIPGAGVLAPGNTGVRRPPGTIPLLIHKNRVAFLITAGYNSGSGMLSPS
jgi:hypothetical protein